MRPYAFVSFVSLVAWCLSTAHLKAAANGLGGKPYMGWSSWTCFESNINEAKIKTQADALSTTLKSYGYEYINVDDFWYSGVDANGRWKADLARFPAGMKGLADYIHGKGLKFGIYLIPGIIREAFDANLPIAGTPYRIRDIVSNPTLQGNTRRDSAYKIDFSRPGAIEFVQGYADLLASWGVDAVKLDFVGPGGGSVGADTREDVAQWMTALKRTGRPIWLELSNSLSFNSVAFWASTSNGWRIDGDIERYRSPALTQWSHVAARFNDAPKWAPWAGQGAWNDLDSLCIGNGDLDGLTLDERRSTLTLWAISCSPLLLGADLTKLDSSDLALLQNREVIAVDQQGRPATPLSQATPQQVWRAQNHDHSYTIAFFNLGEANVTMAVNWTEIGFTGAATVRDLWSHLELGSMAMGWSATLAPHACRLVKVTPLSHPQLVTDGQYRITNRKLGRVITVNGAGLANGSRLVTSPWDTTYSQRWTVTHLGNNIYKIVGLPSGKSLEMNGGSGPTRGQIDIWTSDKGNNQRWRVTSTDHGYFKISNIESNQLIQPGPDGLIEQAPDTQTDVQQWVFNGTN